MRTIAIIIAALTLYSCSGSNPDAQLERYKNKVRGLEQKIDELEAARDESFVAEENETALAVQGTVLEPEYFARTFQVRGSLEAIRDAYISPEINGRIKELEVKRGDRVSAGTLLVRLNTEITERNIQEVRTNLELARRVYEKQEELWKKEIGSELQYLEAKNAKESLEARLATLEEQLQMALIRAPFDGIIDHIMIKEGELAAPGMPLVHLVNLEKLRVSAQVSEAYLGMIRQGDIVELNFSSYPDLVLNKPVSRLGEVINAQTRTFTLEVELENPQGKLKPNMLTSIQIKEFEEKEALVVPSIVLREDFRGTFLYLATEQDGTFMAEKRYVDRGPTVQDRTMITSGLSAGDLLINQGFNLVSEGYPVRMISKN